MLTSAWVLQAEVDRMVDAILGVTAAAVHSGRRMMFSSFDPDVCAALRQRQQHIPVRTPGSCSMRSHAMQCCSCGQQSLLNAADCARNEGPQG